MNDLEIEESIKLLKSAIKSWAGEHNLWNDSKFMSWIEYWDDEPIDPCFLIVYSDGILWEMLERQYEYDLINEFEELLHEFDCYYTLNVELYGLIEIWVDTKYGLNDKLWKGNRNYYEWQWICSLVEPDFSDLYEEVYAWFYKNPEYLYELKSRQFEVLLDGVFRNNGFQTKLGTGQNDGGVDIRLYSNNVIGEVVTLVQARKYSASIPIKLEAVQALSGNVEDERANQGLFVTTSRYLPCAKRFAERQNKRLKLATSEDVSVWSRNAFERIRQEKSQLIKPNHLQFLLDKQSSSNNLEGKIFHANWGFRMILNSFVIVLRESKGAVYLIELPNLSVVNHDFYGYQIPDTNKEAIRHMHTDKVFRAKKKTYKNNNEFYLCGNRNRYSLWDGSPQFYDCRD